jgi:hypothetical protein
MQDGLISPLFITAENSYYVGPYAEPNKYGADYVSGE